MRGSFVLIPDGFIPGVNDSVALGVGLDYAHYDGALGLQGVRDQCLHFEPGPNGTSVCTQVTSNGGSYNYLFVPVVMQWNFWLTRRFSAFGEPGVDLYLLGNHGFGIGPALYLGGRFQIADRMTLTLRIGYPTLALGVSFMMWGDCREARPQRSRFVAAHHSARVHGSEPPLMGREPVLARNGTSCVWSVHSHIRAVAVGGWRRF